MQQRTVIELLMAARDASRLELSEFGKIFPEDKDLPYPTTEKEVTTFIKNRVKLHHNSWITGPIEEVLRLLGSV